MIIDQELPEDIKARPRRSEASLRGHLSSSPENDKETPDAKTNKSEDDTNDKSNLDTKDDSEDKSDESSEGNANVKAKDKTKEKGKSFAYVSPGA